MDTMIEDLEAKGYQPNKESMRSRSKVRRSIKDIEEGKDRVANMALGDSDDDHDIISDDNVAMKEAEQRGRGKKRLRNEVDSDEDMDGAQKAVAKTGRTLTPAQRHLSA